jgi:UDPglucose 6-dehydrogenase
MPTTVDSNQHNIVEEIGVIGAGYVGLVASACFSSFGFQVGIVEVNQQKLESLRQKKVPFFEPGLEELVEDGMESDCLTLHPTTEDLFKHSKPDVVFIAVGTPENPDGSCNLSYVEQAVRDVVRATKNDVVLVLKSTVPVGTARKMADLVTKLAPKFRVAVVNNPEFLKEGSAVSDFLRPERVVLGGHEEWALDKVKALYQSLLHNGRPLFVTDHETAELGKLSANLMLASRVSVINQISRLATAFGADVRQIESILRSDSRIGSKYLYAGMGYGGSCFPKDVKDFIHLCKTQNVESIVAESIQAFNETQKLFFIPDIEKSFPVSKSATIAILGLAFKPETDDIRESPSLKVIETLAARGYSIRIVDPKAMENVRSWIKGKPIEKNVHFAKNLADCLLGADALILATEWQEYQRLALGGLRRFFKGTKVYDGKNVFRPDLVRSWGYEYLGVGRN